MGIAPLAVEAGKVAREEARLPLAVATGGHHQHVVAQGLSESVERSGHGR